MNKYKLLSVLNHMISEPVLHDQIGGFSVWDDRGELLADEVITGRPPAKPSCGHHEPWVAEVVGRTRRVIVKNLLNHF